MPERGREPDAHESRTSALSVPTSWLPRPGPCRPVQGPSGWRSGRDSCIRGARLKRLVFESRCLKDSPWALTPNGGVSKILLMIVCVCVCLSTNT